MADDTLLQSQQFAAPFQAQATQRKFDIYEGVARGQQTAFNQLLALQEMQERSKVNAVHVATEQAKLSEWSKRATFLDMEMNLSLKKAQTDLAIAESRQRLSAIEEKQKEDEQYSKFLGVPMEMNGEWVKFMPGPGGRVEKTKPSDEEVSYAKRERESRVSERQAHADYYRRQTDGQQVTPRHPSLQRSTDAGTLEKLSMPVTQENLRRIDANLPLLDKALSPDEQKKRQDWAMKKAAQYSKQAGATTDQLYRSILEDLDMDQDTYSLFLKEVPGGR
jgi:hypothetical protein